MKILKSWLNDWIDIEDIDSNDISEALESLGFEIESRINITPNYKNIVVKSMRPNKHFLRAHFLTAPVSIKFDQLLKRLRALFKSSSDFP